MFDWVGDIFDTVVNWVSGTAGEAVGAVVGEAVIGAASGAVVGAAIAAINGDDILDGALMGAAYGGLAAGVVSGFGQVTGTDPASTQLDRMGIDRTPSSNSNASTTSDLQYEVAPENYTPINSNSTAITSAKTASDPDIPPKNSSFWKSDAGAKIIAGIGQGAATGAANYLAAGAAADANKELAQQESSIREAERKAKIADNRPGQIYESQVANIKIKDWWNEKFNKLAPAKMQSQGILGGVA